MGIGPYQSHYENGQMKLTVRYDSGKRNGEMIEYYQNGKVMQRGEFKNDERHGEWRKYDIHGNLKEEKKYNNGVEIDQGLCYSSQNEIIRMEGEVRQQNIGPPTTHNRTAQYL
jgi:hypothetical protein